MTKPDTSAEAVKRLNVFHRLVCFENGDHPYKIDTPYSLGADALIKVRALSEALQAAEAENERLREALNDTAEHLYVAAAEGLASRYDARIEAFRRARTAPKGPQAMTHTQEQIAALVKKLRSQIGDDVQHIYDHEALFKLSANMLEQLAAERNTCPLGDDCDLTVAWMVGYSKGFEEAREAAAKAAEKYHDECTRKIRALQPKGKTDE